MNLLLHASKFQMHPKNTPFKESTICNIPISHIYIYYIYDILYIFHNVIKQKRIFVLLLEKIILSVTFSKNELITDF